MTRRKGIMIAIKSPEYALATCLFLVACNSQTQTVQQQPLFPDIQSPGYAALNEQCSSCHASPRPEAHTIPEWERVVRRMQSYRVQRGLGAIADRDMQALLDYLKKYAGTQP